MTQKELKRAEVLAQVVSRKMTMKQGAEEVNLSLRQFRRMRRRYELSGIKSLAHRSRGRSSGRSLSPEKSEQIKYLLKKYYPDFGATFAAEKLSQCHSIVVSREKVRQIQMELGLWKPKKKKERKYHPRRARRSREGDLIQIDGSDHDWLEGRGERMTLTQLSHF
jgi:transposase